MKAANLSPLDIIKIFEQAKIPNKISEIEYLNKGGQKTVYKCKIDDIYYALKIIEIETVETTSEENLTTQDFVSEIFSRAKREIDIMRMCESEYLVQLGPIGLTYTNYLGAKLIFYTEDLITGESLDNILRSRKLSEQEGLDLSLNITSAINSLWEIGMVHRDIKPQNIMMNTDGKFILLDAGIAFDTKGEILTRTFHLVGTPIYMSPEQVESRRTDLDFRSDLYLLGLVLYQGLTGKHPYYEVGMNSVQIANKIVESTPPRFNEINISINTNFEKVIYRLLSYQPHLRFRSCDSLQDKLYKIKGEIL